MNPPSDVGLLSFCQGCVGSAAAGLCLGQDFGQGDPGSSCEGLSPWQRRARRGRCCLALWGLFLELESCRGELWLWVLGTSPGRLAADPVLP